MKAPVDLHTRLALDASELAEALGVSERLVRDMQSEIPHTWLGRRVVFPVDQVREWLGNRVEAHLSAGQGLAEEILNEMKGT